MLVSSFSFFSLCSFSYLHSESVMPTTFYCLSLSSAFYFLSNQPYHPNHSFSSITVEELLSRRTGKREHEYEVKWEGQTKENSWHTRSELKEWGYEKMVNQKDEIIAMESMLGQRKLTTGEIQRHFDGFGLEPQFAQHTRMGALSGKSSSRLFYCLDIALCVC